MTEMVTDFKVVFNIPKSLKFIRDIFDGIICDMLVLSYYVCLLFFFLLQHFMLNSLSFDVNEFNLKCKYIANELIDELNEKYP